MTTPTVEEAPVQSSHGADLAVAVRNAIKLGGSLLATWTIALVVRFQLPRHLGPERFGAYNFCDYFAASYFAFAGLGINTYIQKEVSVRPQHISDFFGGTLVLRALLSGLLVGGMLVTLLWTGRSEQMPLALVFAASQFVLLVNGSLAATMQAATKVGALASINVISKLLWGIGLAAAIWFDLPLLILAVPSLVSELLRTCVLWPVARKQAHVRMHLRLAETKVVVAASLPFFVNEAALGLCQKLDVSMLEFQSTRAEVGWYSAASNIAGLAFLLSPLFGWVLMPLLSRAKHRSEDEFFHILRRALEAMVVITIPITAMIAIGADFWAVLAFGRSFAPSAHTLRVLAPMFIVTYLTTMLAIALILTNRSWRLTLISIFGLIVQPALSLTFVPLMSRLGVGHAGSGSAMALIGQEIVASALLLSTIGKQVVDTRLVVATAKSAGIVIAILALDRLILGLGPVRLAVESLVYLALALATRTVRLGEARDLVRVVRHRG